MKKPRPTARDRDIVDWLRKMKPGNWLIDVEDQTSPPFGLAPIKHEGSISMDFTTTIVRIYPQ